jgi:uncharacterized protein DUF6519/parallel beta helix pectate lyase-like protein
MSGDYTRVRYAPQSGYIGVLEQQGRVRLDADGNEQVESIDRRRRAESIDTIGHGVVPSITPNAFLIQTAASLSSWAAGTAYSLGAQILDTNGTVQRVTTAGTSGSAQPAWNTTPGGTTPDNTVTWTNEGVIGKFTIGPGRAYVDGILVDCWGDDASQQFQPDLGELRSPNPLAFEKQPFYYTPNFPAPASSGTSIVYLDVWEREVTSLEDPGLIDPAIEGIDTTTRLQAAWQVKALSPTSATTCNDNPPEWLNLIAPSTGVLSTAPAQAPSGASPCVIDPVGGYTGLENRLYRVQVSQSGIIDATGVANATQARFVWSKNNASLGAALLSITHISATECQLSVSTVGRDKTFGFQVNDNLEVLDDFVEWSMRETGTGGTPVTVTKVDPEQLTINVTPDISGSFTVVAGQHPRIRKWDAAPQPTKNGTAIPLGSDGVTVTFGPNASATLAAGDYWVFYARTATGTIEVLNQASPRGVLHHYMKLALVNPGLTPPVHDCRTFWPPSMGCCTVVVNVGDDIQAAIESLPQQGGCVCVKAGVHNISQPIVIQGQSNIVLHGESISAVVQNSGSTQALIISDGGTGPTTDITVEQITFLVTPQPEESAAIVTINNPIRCAVRECKLGSTTPGQAPFATLGFSIIRSINQSQYQPVPSFGDFDVEIRGSTVGDVIGGVLAQGVYGLNIVDNLVAARTTQDATGNVVSAGMVGIDVILPGGVVCVSDNRIADFSQGVVVQTLPVAPSPNIFPESPPQQLSIERNLVVRHGLASSSVISYGWTDPLGSLLQQKAYGIFADAAGATIAENNIGLADPGHGGILVTGSDVEVRDNSIPSSIVAALAPPSSPPSVAPDTGGITGMLFGTYTIAVTFTSGTVESQLSPMSEPATVSGTNIIVSNIPTADPSSNVTGRNVYGSKSGVSSGYQLIGTIDNTTNTFTVTTDEPSWGKSAPAYEWPSLPIGIVGYNPTIVLMDRCRIEENVLSGPQRGIAVLTELQKLTELDSPTVEGNRITNGVTPETIDLNGPQQTIATLENSLRSLGSAFGIFMFNATGATIARNVISQCTVGIVAFHSDSAVCDGNNVQQCTIGILLSSGRNSNVNNGVLRNNQLAIGLHSVQSTVVGGNRCEFTELRARIVPGVVHCLALTSMFVRFKENIIWGAPHTGFLAYESRSVWFERNLVEGSGGTGIVAVMCQDQICFDRNDLNGCGVKGKSAIEANLVAGFQINGWQVGTAVSSAIAAVDCAGVITIDGCNIRETVQESGARCADICVLGGAHTRIRDCRVVRTGDIAPVSRALLLQTAADHEDTLLTHADVGGNYIDVTSLVTGTDFMVVEVDSPTQSPPDVIFVGNTIIKRGTANQNFAVALGADKSRPCGSLAVTGNRIHTEALGEDLLPALLITYAGGLSYVGNVLTSPATIIPLSGINEQPTPPGHFNVIA